MIKRLINTTAFVLVIAIQFTLSQSICESALTLSEIEDMIEEFDNPSTGIAVFEHFGDETGYFYEVRNNCPNVSNNGPLPPGFAQYGGTFLSCDGTLICTYGFDRPLPCNSELNLTGLDLTKATQRSFVFSTPCGYDGSIIEVCGIENLNISTTKSRPIYPTSSGLPLQPECTYSRVSISPDEGIQMTENGFRILAPTNERYEVTLFTDQSDCSPLNFVYTIREDEACQDITDSPEIFNSYPFLNNVIDHTDCGNSSVIVYNLNGNIFLFVSTNENERLYLADGTLYCTNSSSLSCEETYGLSQIIDEWQCQAIEEQFVFATICSGDPLPLYRSRYTLGESTFQACGPEGPIGSPPRMCPCQLIFSLEISPKDGVISELVEGNLFEIVPQQTTTYTIVARTGGAPDNPCIPMEFTEEFTIVVRSPDECSGCACAAVFDPVCGEDGVTYSNECEALCNNVNIIGQGECEIENPEEIFQGFPFLMELVDPNNCTNEIIEAYVQDDNSFIYVINDAGGTLYLEDGSFFCQDGGNASCIANAGLNQPILTWRCSSNCICQEIFAPVCGEDGETYTNACEAECRGIPVIAMGECSTSQNCEMASGTIVFEPCDDGRTFFFVRTGSGNLFDLYFAAGIEFEVFEGQEVSFDFELADFDSPCSIADAAIVATCIEDITRPNDCRDNSGTIFFEECNGQTFFLLETDDGRILDPYFEDGPTIEIVEGLRIRFDYFLADFTTPCLIAEGAVFLTCVEENFVPDQEDLLSELEAFVLGTINQDDCNSDDLTISFYETGGEFAAYVRSEGVGTLYDQRGNFLCSDGASISCTTSFNLRNPIKVLDCSAIVDTGNSTGEFDDYPWINDRIDQTDCNVGSFVEIYENNGYAFVFIDDGSGGVLYDASGGLYCTDSPTLSCREVYGLNNASITWTCGDSSSDGNNSTFNEEIFFCPEDSVPLEIPTLGAFNTDSGEEATCPPGFPCDCSLVTEISVVPDEDIIQFSPEEGILLVAPEQQTSYAVTIFTDRSTPDSTCDSAQFQTIFTAIPSDEACSNIVQQADSDLNVYPNPATNELFLSGLQQWHKHLNISDVYGNIVWQTKGFVDSKIDLSKFNDGVYFMSIQQENGQFETIKFIVQK